MASRLISADWFRWSDGSEFSVRARDGFKRLMRKKSLRLHGETAKDRFMRFRRVIEAAERRRAADAS